MVDSLSLRNLIWLLVSLVEVLFLVYLIFRRAYRSHLFFFLYALSLVVQTAWVALVYWHWGSASSEYSYAAWVSQALVVGMRWFAVSEIARKIVAKYTGVWRLANIILFCLGLSVLLYAILISNHQVTFIVMAADRGVELCIAVFIVVLFAFARYYRLPVADLERQLAIGFCLYSCVWVINETIYQGWRHWLGPVWDFILTIAFLASLVLWIRAFRESAAYPVTTAKPEISPEIYAQLSEEVNSRLLTLNTRLNHLLRSQDSRS